MSIPDKTLVEPPVDEKLHKLHVVLLMMLSDFSAICKQHNLEWLGMYGTAIGALRHKGFIPWDDDIDICMPRDHLDAFCKIVTEEHSDKYSVINAQISSDYPLATTRFMLKGTKFFDDNLASMKFNSGIFLDLFALDALAPEEGKAKKQSFFAWFYNKLALVRDVANPYIANKGFAGKVLRLAVTAARHVLNAPGIREIDWNKKSLKHAVRYNKSYTEEVAYFCDTLPGTCVYKRKDLYPARSVPFEVIEINVAYRAEELLSAYYGNWQEPIHPDLRREHYPNTLEFGDYEPQ